MRTFIVYMHVNKLDNKKYVGITCQEPKKRWKHGSCYKGSPHFYRAIKRDGWDNFEHLILFTGLSEKEAKQTEIDLISKYQLMNPKFGYNLSAGGQGRLKYTTLAEKALRIAAEKAWHDNYNNTHKEYFRQKNKEYYQADPDKFKQKSKQYYIKNKTKIQERSKNYKLKHKEAIQLKSKETAELRKKLRSQLLIIAKDFPERFSEAKLLKLAKRDTCRSIEFLTTLLNRVNF